MNVAPHFPVNNHYDKFTVAVDFDGCLNIDGEANRPLIEMCMRLERTAHMNIVVFSARPPANHHVVHEWLRLHCPELYVAHICLGAKPAADVFVDDRGLLPPIEALEAHIHRVYNGHSLNALTHGDEYGPFSEQMASCWENPFPNTYEPPDGFTVCVPVSAGIDSTTAWAMAAHAGLRVQPVYVATGAEYNDTELRVATGKLWPVLRTEPVQVLTHNPPLKYEQWQHVDRARNAAIVYLVARWMRDNGRWGEIWFGNVAEWAETPIAGGDKSHRWLLTMQQLLTLEGYDVRLASPLGGMTKTDCVRWLDARHLDDLVDATRSCYADDDAHCGECRSCFRRWLAIEAAGHSQIRAWPGTNELRFQEQAALFLNDCRTQYANDVANRHPEWSSHRWTPHVAAAHRWTTVQ